MKENEIYNDSLRARRDFFQMNFPMLKIGKKRVNIPKNTCPVCGYLTLEERDAFNICGICFWEDDGIDDFEENEISGPNHMTLKEGRAIFNKAKEKLMTSSYAGDHYIKKLKDSFLQVDHIIKKGDAEKNEIIKLQDNILDLLNENKVYGLEQLFEK